MSKILTLKGKRIDIAALRERNSATVAIGNGSMNARGDVIDRSGKVVKTKEQIGREYYDNNPKSVAVSTISLKDISDEIMTPAQAIKALETAAAAKATAPAAPKRKIKDSED